MQLGFQTALLEQRWVPWLFLEGKNAKERIIALNVVLAYLEDQSLLTSKLAGIYSIVISVNEICQDHHISEGEIKVGCNNIEVL